MTTELIRGRTTIAEILHRYPDGRAALLMSRLSWACAMCGVAPNEPLAMAAKKHGRSPKAVLEAFRALDAADGPDDALIEAAQARI